MSSSSPHHQRPVYIPKRRRPRVDDTTDTTTIRDRNNNDIDDADGGGGRGGGRGNSNNTNDGQRSSTKKGYFFQQQKKQQQQQQQRFHGAFTGGFSAGHFNTVGTKEGWMPSGNDDVRRRSVQRLEDFMDEEDYAEWGGPTMVRDEYNNNNNTKKKNQNKNMNDNNNDYNRNIGTAIVPFLDHTSPTTMMDEDDEAGSSSKRGDVISGVDDSTTTKTAMGEPSSLLAASLGSILEVKHQTVGPRLLRCLGWRESGTAFVPDDGTSVTLGMLNNGDRSSTTMDDIHNKKDDDETNNNNNYETMKIHLSNRRLRLIQLQTVKMKLPPPKLDHCGLGFEPYQDAPEFEQYRQRRQQRARDRSTYNTNSSSSQQNNVYRLRDVVVVAPSSNSTTTINERRDISNEKDPPNDGDYLTYETAEEFVGKRSATGFALRDDEDDAYDNTNTGTNNRSIYHDLVVGEGRQLSSSSRTKATLMMGGEYNAEVYEYETSSDEDGDDGRHNTSISKGGGRSTKTTTSTKIPDVGNLFASWAGTDKVIGGTTTGATQPSRTSHQALTSDGDPPLVGFVLGGSMNIAKKRYPGPDIPREYQVEKHVFGANEHPAVFETISRAVRLEQEDAAAAMKKQQQQWQGGYLQSSHNVLGESSSRIDVQRPLHLVDRSRSNGPLGGNDTFALLASSMKNRFTSGTEVVDDSGIETKVGLHMPDPIRIKTKNATSEQTAATTLKTNAQSTQNTTITRTVRPFTPHPMVCKRLHVPAPKHASAIGGTTTGAGGRIDEATYFEKEILQKAKNQKKRKDKSKVLSNEEKVIDSPLLQNDSIPPEEESNELEEPTGIERPSISNLKAIFDASSDESSSSSDEEKVAQSDAVDVQTNNAIAEGLDLPPSGQTLVEGTISRDLVKYDRTDRDDDSDEKSSESGKSDPSPVSRSDRRKRRSKKHRRKRHSKRRRSRSPSVSETSSNSHDDDDGDDIDKSSSDEDADDESDKKHRKRRKKKKDKHRSKDKKKKKNRKRVSSSPSRRTK